MFVIPCGRTVYDRRYHKRKIEGNRSSGIRLTYDVLDGKGIGTFTVRVCWCTTVYRDEVGFVESHFMY